MSFLNALYNTYNYALEHNLVGDTDKKKSLILPLYYNSMKSDGKNIVELLVDRNSNLMAAYFLEKDDIIIFPVTEDSVARTSGVSPHPLVDNFDYLVDDGGKKSTAYYSQLEDWLDFDNNDFIRIIYKFLKKENVFKKILDKLYQNYKIIKGKNIEYNDSNGKARKINFSKVFISFKIEDYEGQKDLSVSENKDLYKRFENYQDYLFKEDPDTKEIICNISGKKDFLCLKHRPLLGSARLISQITANNENYLGRFKDPGQTIKIGKKSSQKVIQMAKALYEGVNTSKWLGEQIYALSWFSDDIKNESEFDISKSLALDNPLIFLSDTEDTGIETIADETSKDIVSSFTSGRVKFNEASKYYLAIIDKVSNGRVAIKYFRQVDGSRLVKNLESWQKKYNTLIKSKDKGAFIYTPSPYQMIVSSYGVERDGKLKVGKKRFLSDQYVNILTAIIEGRDIPSNLIKAIKINIKNRLKYDKTWYGVKTCALAMLKDKEGIESYMLDRNNTDRSYLYGRLLALYERLEASCYDSKSERLTNAEKLWTSYTYSPHTINMRLRNLVKPYEKKLKFDTDKKGIYFKIKKNMDEVFFLLDDNYFEKKLEDNSPLEASFIYGYEGQMRDLFTKKEIDRED